MMEASDLYACTMPNSMFCRTSRLFSSKPLISDTQSPRSGLQLQPANYAHIVAIPHHPLPDGHAVRQRIRVAQLDLFNHFSRLGIVLEKRVEIGIGDPQVFSFPSDSMRTVPRCRKLCLDHPGLGIYPIDFA